MDSYDMQVELGINSSKFEYVYDENEGRRVITQVKNVLTAIKYNTVENYDEYGNYAPYVPLQFIIEEVENLKNIIKTEKE